MTLLRYNYQASLVADFLFLPQSRWCIPKNNRKPTTDCENIYGLETLIRIDHKYREYNHLLTVSNFAIIFFWNTAMLYPCFFECKTKYNCAENRCEIPSKYMKTPSLRLQGLRWRTMTAGMTFFRRSGLPFFTVAMTMSPTAAAGSLFNRPFTPFTEMTYRFFAPVLSAQLTTAPTGRASDIRNLFPADPPLPAIHSPFPISSLFSNPLAYYIYVPSLTKRFAKSNSTARNLRAANIGTGCSSSRHQKEHKQVYNVL